MTITDAPYIYYVHPGSTATSRLASSILDHPTVQFETLQRCMEEIGLYQKYRDDIALYFLEFYWGNSALDCRKGRRGVAFRIFPGDAKRVPEFVSGLAQNC